MAAAGHLFRATPVAGALALLAHGTSLHTLGTALGALSLGTLATTASLMAVSFGLSFRVRQGVRALGVDRDGVTFTHEDHSRRVGWGAITRWQVVPRAEHDEVQIELHDGDVLYASLPRDAASERLLAIAEEVHARRALVVPLCPGGSGTSRWLMVLGAFGPALAEHVLSSAGWPVLGMMVFAAWVLAFVSMLRRQHHARVIVGDDGVDIAAEGSHRFVPYSRVANVDWDECGVILDLRDGDSVTLSVMEPEMMRATAEAAITRAQARRDALHERICQRWTRWAAREERGHEDGGAVRLLDRNGRTLDAWVSAVRALVPEAGLSYRHLVLDHDAVAMVLEDPNASVERRVAAAFALARRDDPGLQQRVRVVMDSCASAPVRAAIDRAAHDALDEQTLDLVLEATAERER